jgi:Mrp family chromosome partitioning ATPase
VLSEVVPATAPPAKPAIAWLRQGDVQYRGIGSDLHGLLDLGRMGWPALRSGTPNDFTEAMRALRVAATERSSTNLAPVLVVVGENGDIDRSIGALNMALAAAQDGIDVLLVDADFRRCILSHQVGPRGAKSVADGAGFSSGLGEPVESVNGVTVLPISLHADPAITSEAVRAIVDHARRTTECGLVVVDGPAIPFAPHDRTLLDIADGVVAVLPASPEIDNAMEEVIAALNGAERKLLGVVLTEFDDDSELKELQYA